MASFTDDFNRADGDIGANWLVDAGQMFVVSNKAESQVPDIVNRARYATALDSVDHYAEAIIGGKSDDKCGGVTVRQESSTQTYYTGDYHGEDQNEGYRITKLVDGEGTEIDSALSGVGIHTLRLEVAGAVQRLYIDGGGEPVASGADSAITAGQYVGIEVWGNTGGRWDDWSAADLAALVPNDAKIVVLYT